MDWGFRKEYTNKIWMLLFLMCASFHIGWVGIWVVPWVGLWYGMKKRWGGVKNLLLTQLWLCTVVTDILSWQEGTYKWRIVLTVDNWFVIALFHWIPDSWTDWHTCYTRSEITCLRMHLNGSSIFPSWYVNLCQLPSWLFFSCQIRLLQHSLQQLVWFMFSTMPSSLLHVYRIASALKQHGTTLPFKLRPGPCSYLILKWSF